ncbi:MAG: hypothetical protein H6508_00125 [Calditrichaeota bacterium]|nr:hypothetical protein [Calditrichota bacterium]
MTLALALFLLGGCAARRTTVFLHPEYDFALVERVAVASFENLSREQGVSAYATRLFITELLSAQAFDVVEPGETARILARVGQERAGELDLAGLRKVQDSLGVQAVIFGSVGEAAALGGRSGTSHVVSIDARMVDCQTGTTVWSASVSIGGPSALARTFGAGENTRSDAVHKAVRKLVKLLLH